MRIDIKNLRIAASLSEETTAYTATIHIDGKPAFHASNHGHGGCDLYQRVAADAPSEESVNAWLAEHEPPMGPFEADPAKRAAYDIGIACDLEQFVGRAISALDDEKQWKRVLAKISVLKGGEILSYPAKYKPTPANLASVRAKLKPGEELINDGDADLIRRAKIAFGLKADDDGEEAVLERLREGRLTAADCRYLIAKEKRGDVIPTEDLVESLEDIATAQEKGAEAYRAEIDAKRASERALAAA
jgi:hypothetical protein